MGTVSTAKFGEIEAIHRRAAKFIHKLTGSEDPLEQANWKPLEYIYKRRVVTIMHEVYHEDNSKIFSEIFKKKVASRTTRSNNTFEIPRPKCELGRTSIRYRGPLTWNYLPRVSRNN